MALSEEHVSLWVEGLIDQYAAPPAPAKRKQALEVIALCLKRNPKLDFGDALQRLATFAFCPNLTSRSADEDEDQGVDDQGKQKWPDIAIGREGRASSRSRSSSCTPN